MDSPNYYHYCRPWVVIDWGVLRALPAESGIPGRFTAVIPDRTLMEAIETSQPDAFVRKLENVLMHPDSHNRIIVGRYWNDISRAEETPRRLHNGSVATVHQDLSSQLLRRQGAGGPLFLPRNEWPCRVGSDDKKPNFIQLARDYVDWMRENRPDELKQIQRGTVEARRKLIQQPGEAIANLAVESSSRYRSRAWRRVLMQYPDRCAVGRWLRVVIWYAMCHAATPDRAEARLGNDYDDAHYAFLSLYTSHIWTRDAGLAVAVRAVSGNRVHAHSSWESIPVYGS